MVIVLLLLWIGGGGGGGGREGKVVLCFFWGCQGCVLCFFAELGDKVVSIRFTLCLYI